MDPLVLKKLNQARKDRKACAVVTSLVDGRDRLVIEGEPVEGTLGEAINTAMKSGKPSTFQDGEEEFFINVYLPSLRLMVIGAVHISQALAPMAKAVGLDVTIIDPRTAFATQERFGDVTLHAEWPEDVLGNAPLDRYCALAALTHDPKIDDYAIQHALVADCFYVGALGSRKTQAARVARLLAEDISQAQCDRIKAPIGLDIGAANPPEIAVAIIAEVIEAFRQREA